MKLLLIEDDREISEMVRDFLISENFECDAVYDGEQACALFEKCVYDLLVLDLMLPKMTGMEVLRRVRKESTVPIIILSAKDSDSDITLGLGLGADDYIVKPFSITQLLARIKANLRRVRQYSQREDKEKTGILTWGELHMNLKDYTVCKGAEKIELTAKEFEILKLFMKHPQRVYTKEQIYSQIWKDTYLGDENAVNVHISRLRNKIEDQPRSPQYIITVWGIGYKLGEKQ